jgi:hypothetical protein
VDRVVQLAKGLAAGVSLEDAEDVRGVGGGETLKEGLDGLGKVVVELVAVRPDCVTASLRNLLKLEDGERGRVRLE